MCLVGVIKVNSPFNPPFMISTKHRPPFVQLDIFSPFKPDLSPPAAHLRVLKGLLMIQSRRNTKQLWSGFSTLRSGDTHSKKSLEELRGRSFCFSFNGLSLLAETWIWAPGQISDSWDNQDLLWITSFIWRADYLRQIRVLGIFTKILN